MARTQSTTLHAVYGPGYGNGVTIVWPPPSLSQNGNNNAYGNVSLGYIEIDQARAGVQTTNISVSAGQTLSVLGFASGQQPITYQWYLAPNTLLAGQTSATLAIPNATTNNSGTYFLTASNALGGEQSANVAVSVTSIPVSISQQPTNLTVFANYPATFSVTATGTPVISYQWSRNSVSIPGATSSAYSLMASSTNNGDVYSCVASNFTSGTPYTATSSSATLTVTANQAQPQEILHGARANATNNFGGMVGGIFGVGNSSVTVTHLGYYASQFTDSHKTNGILTMNHRVGIFSPAGTVLYGSVTVPSGTNNVVNGYMWAPLNPPLVLTNNASYLLAAEVFSGSPTPDPWGDTYAVPDWNPYFTGTTGASTSFATYWGAAWPGGGVSGNFGGQMYSAPNLAILAPSTASIFVAPTNVTQYVGFNATLTATVDGQAPLTLQWYKAPSTLLSGQTSLTLNLNNLALGDSGNYYVIATNPGGPVQSGNATVTVQADTGPIVTQDIQSQNVYVHQTVIFAATVSGTPPLSYQWTFNGNPIAGATQSALTLADASTASIGNYQLTITNNYGSTNSSIAALGVTIPAWGSYPSGVMGSNLLAYYRFSDVNSGTVATNQGSLGFAYNGTYEGGYSGVAGPTGLSNFESTNLAVSLDGFTGDVLLPPLNNVVVSNITIAAWVYDAGGQPANTAIVFHRSTDVFGLSTFPNPTTSVDELRYTWNGAHYGFSSGLQLPVNQWVFIAMVINPTNATLYLQDGTGMKSTNNAATLTASAFSGNSYIGWDTAGGATGRRWTGPIDEVMVFNTALSATAVNALYLGVPGSAKITIAPSGSNLVVTWPGGTLLESTNVTGPWTPTTGATNGSYTVTPSGANKFYRVKLQ